MARDRNQVAAANTSPLLLRCWPMTNLSVDSAALGGEYDIRYLCMETIVEVR